MILIKMIAIIVITTIKKAIVSETVSVTITAQWICHIMPI